MVVAVAVVLVVIVFTGVYAAWTAGRLDRQHVRLDAAAAGLDAQLLHRAQVAHAVPELAAAAEDAERTIELGPEREQAENRLSKGIREVLDADRLSAAQRTVLVDAVARAAFARAFHNDAVRDALVLRQRRMVQLLHLFGHARQPAYFEIDDVTTDVSGEIADVARASSPYD